MQGYSVQLQRTLSYKKYSNFGLCTFHNTSYVAYYTILLNTKLILLFDYSYVGVAKN